jgi:hypothetical protein
MFVFVADLRVRCRNPKRVGELRSQTTQKPMHTGTRNTTREENPGPKKQSPVRSPPPGHKNIFFYYRGLPCERTHHGKGLSIACHVLHVAPYLASSSRRASLRSNNYRNSSNNYQRSRFIIPIPPPSSAIIASDALRTEP